jgi:biotin carboxylase
MAEPDARRPRLAVVYGHRSLDVMQLAAAARGWCDLIWLIDQGDESAQAVRRLLERFGTVVDALGESPSAAADAVRPFEPDGLATFYDTGMAHVAEVAAALGLRFNSAASGRALEDKLHQREAFRSAGLPTPGTVDLPVGADRAAVERLGGEIDYPAVLKPRSASGSWHTFRVESAAELGELWQALDGGGGEPMIVEEYLPDGPPMPGGFEADYVSVETVALDGELYHLGLTGRFPLVAPFRETGFFVPSTLGPQQSASVVALASEALRAVGFETGCAHTEIKLTSDGPRVIEINGRIGGGVPEMLRLAAGIDMVAMAMRAALGQPPAIDGLPATTGVGYRFFYQPPSGARRVRAVDGIEELKRFPGVESVRLHRPPGTEIDAREGTRSYLFAVVGAAADTDGLLAVDDFLRTGITATYD